MIKAETCEWLIENADKPIRYRVYREIMKDDKAAVNAENELLDNPVVKLWLSNLKPKTPPQNWYMEHGSWDFCFENALLKIVNLGLHSGFPQVVEAVQYYVDTYSAALSGKSYRRNDGFQMQQTNTGFNSILVSNFFCACQFSKSICTGPNVRQLGCDV